MFPAQLAFVFHDTQQFAWLRVGIVTRNTPCFPFVRCFSWRICEVDEIIFVEF
jgi:hypothetical protein